MLCIPFSVFRSLYAIYFLRLIDDHVNLDVHFRHTDEAAPHFPAVFVYACLFGIFRDRSFAGGSRSVRSVRYLFSSCIFRFDRRRRSDPADLSRNVSWRFADLMDMPVGIDILYGVSSCGMAGQRIGQRKISAVCPVSSVRMAAAAYPLTLPVTQIIMFSSIAPKTTSIMFNCKRNTTGSGVASSI